MEKTGSSALTVTTCGLVLQIWLFIKTQFDEFAFVKPDETVNPIKNIFLANLNIFIYTMLFFFVKYL